MPDHCPTKRDCVIAARTICKGFAHAVCAVAVVSCSAGALAQQANDGTQGVIQMEHANNPMHSL